MQHKFVISRVDENVVTVGSDCSDITGFDNRAVQLAVDVVHQRGGGTVKLSEGTFEIMGPVRLYSNIKLTGSGEKTVLHKCEGYKTEFITDADYGENIATVRDSSGFKPGMGLMLIDSNHSSAWDVSTAVITRVENNNIYFDNYLVRDYSSQAGGVVSNACSIIEGVQVANCIISNLVIDGNCESNDMLDGCRGGAIYLHKAQSCLVEKVAVKNFSGDGISWQITNDITVRNCEVSGCTNYGIHPGSGSGESRVENCDIHHNGTVGFFVCWRVQNGSFRNNKIYKNGHSGISIGHKDTGNLFEGNDIFENGYCGIYIRNEIESNGAHNNTYINNTIRDNGNSENGFGILYDGAVRGNIIKDNVIRDSGNNVQKIGIALKGCEIEYSVKDNSISAPVKDIILK